MPWKLEFIDGLLKNIQNLSKQQKKDLLSKIEDIRSLEDMTEQGGKYFKHWAYPYAGTSLLICKVDYENKTMCACSITKIN